MYAMGSTDWSGGNTIVKKELDYSYNCANLRWTNESLTFEYFDYKRKYVKHLTFNPKEKNFSKDLPFYQLV